ncbi:MAG: sensor histidine kinase [Actinomycetota bacterium]|nr:sensor histidine kinase [Actinomycetota bacterium]
MTARSMTGTLRRHPLASATAALAALATLLITVLPFVRFAYRSPNLHIGVETAAGLIAVLVAYLFYGRYRSSGRLTDLLLVCALGLFAFANLFLSMLPSSLSGSELSQSFATWAPLCVRLVAAGLFTAAALVPERLLRRPRRAAAAAVAASAMLFLAVAAVVASVGSRLPRGIDPTVSPKESPLVTGQPTVLSLQLVAMVLFAAAALGFLHRRERTGDELMQWLAAGALLAAFSRLNYFLFPSLYSEWIYTGDFLRFAFYAPLLIGGAREIGGYWKAAARAQILEERRRMARDLHDGLAQELAFIVMQTRRLREADDKPMLSYISEAAELALDESRRAISALTRPFDEPLPVVLAQVAEDVGLRSGIQLRLDLEDGIDAPLDVRETLLRVVREAVTNAARHANATTVAIDLSYGDGLRLRIADDGRGFDPEARRTGSQNGGFGLVSMKERVEALGGRLEVMSRPGAGTEIEVALP